MVCKVLKDNKPDMVVYLFKVENPTISEEIYNKLKDAIPK